jgi:hypothetical protein
MGSNGEKVAKIAGVEKRPEIGAVCRKVQLTFFLEQTEDGETVQEFRPVSEFVYQRGFGEPLDLKAMAESLCQQALTGVAR